MKPICLDNEGANYVCIDKIATFVINKKPQRIGNRPVEVVTGMVLHFSANHMRAISDEEAIKRVLKALQIDIRQLVFASDVARTADTGMLTRERIERAREMLNESGDYKFANTFAAIPRPVIQQETGRWARQPEEGPATTPAELRQDGNF